MGISLAQYNLAMQGFDHPAAHRNHRWNLAEAGQHRDKICLVEDPEKRALLAWGFDAWEQVKSDLKSLPWQFIHGDMNRENILVRGDRVTGLVDFGDSCFNPAVCDLDRGFHITAQDRSGQSELVWRRRISVGFIGDIKGRTDSDLADYMMIMESAVCTPGHWQPGSARCSWFVPPPDFDPGFAGSAPSGG